MAKAGRTGQGKASIDERAMRTCVLHKNSKSIRLCSVHIPHRFINIHAEFTPDINKVIIECEWQRNERNFIQLNKLNETRLFSICFKLNMENNTT